MFPINGSVTRPLPSLLTGFRGIGFPAFNRYYEGAKTSRVHPARSVSFAWRYRSLRSGVSFSWMPEAPSTSPGLGRPDCPCRRCGSGDQRDLPSSQGTRLCICPALRPRQDRAHQANTVGRCCPRHHETEGSYNVEVFRGSMTRLLHSLSTLRAAITDDDARLASGGWLTLTGWGWLPTGFR